MSRFKFTCNCGKRLAAYDWQVGRIVSCPKCGRMLTIPTPFQAEDQLNEMIDRGYKPTRRKVGRPVEKKSRLKVILVVGIGLVVAAAVAAVVIHRLLP